jgi:hypothetical protein
MNIASRRMLQAMVVTGLLGAVALLAVDRDYARAASYVLATTADGTAVEEPAVATSVADPISALVARIDASAVGDANRDSAIRVILSRDPFRRVVPDFADPADPADPTGPADPADPTGPVPAEPDEPSTPPVTGQACSGDAAETVCEGTVVTLTAIDLDAATVVVDATTYEVMAGDSFATSFRVLAVDSSCVTLQYGDESFSLCVGATVLK